ncbi:MAG TPA: ATP-binding cassette domain-containing protein [Bacteroidales bacterium]|jgi:ABC-type multidrug transport system ATPase subunit|nr:ATP-binding cassette domain-containing protein [Bacteroidales bacterium]
MSEEILKALMQLFAIIAKQDEGVESTQMEYVRNFLQQQLNDEKVREYFQLFRQYSGLETAEGEDDKEEEKEEKNIRKLTSVKDSVRILGLCKKINKTLTQKQKVVVLVRLFEIVNADRKFTDQRMQIINTVAEVFKVDKDEFSNIQSFVISNETDQLDNSNMLIITDSNQIIPKNAKLILTKHLQGKLFVLKINSVDLYFLKYTGSEDLFLNGLPVRNDRIYLFANGSAIKLPKGAPVYYSDVVAHFMADMVASQISYIARNLEYKFPNGNIGIKDISFSETHGRLIGIMGASGAGKTTLLNVLCGIEPPSNGEVLINNINLHNEKNKLEGVIGLVPQDDLLIEELTVYENLFYNARLCFKDKSEEEIDNLVNKTLQNLGLYDRKDLKVGSPMKKTISGGQRKRLNIALELIREPSILFVDEPTSGLSSRDSENVMDLLRELALKGKLIFVVIHQPSSEIYKMFDKMIILDTGGYMIYYGNPVEAVMYFKHLDAQINSDVGECQSCGNVNPELIFNIIEARVVDEFGNYTDNRKVLPQEWHEHYKSMVPYVELKSGEDSPPKNLRIPGWLKQFRIYTTRDFFSKISNTQYVALSMLEAPVLGFILSYIIRYIEDPNSNQYIFRVNENIPIYIFMALIVALFLGLTVSAEEIFRDRKILKRERFLNLSRSSYLVSKVIILFTISAIQALLFILVANTILGIRDMGFIYWFALFSTAAFANILGLNISASFNSAVTIYILIPLVMIPMMILSGAMFSFDKLNRNVSRIDKVPVIAEFMVTKWSYEALMVHQFKDNRFMKSKLYDLEKEESLSDFKKVYWLPELTERLERINNELNNTRAITMSSGDLIVIANEIAKESAANKEVTPFPHPENLLPGKFDSQTAAEVAEYLNALDIYYGKRFEKVSRQKDNYFNYYLDKDPDAWDQLRDRYHNEGVSDIVRKVFEKNKILEYDHQLVQHYDPIYQEPYIKGVQTLRTHFYAPKKPFLGKVFDTYWYNMVFIWLLTIILYIALYYEWLLKLINFSERFKKKG